MTELRSETQALLDLGREGDDPNDAAIERNRRQLAARLGGAALGGAVVGTAAKAAAASGSAVSGWASAQVFVACGALLAGGAVLGGYAWRSQAAVPAAAQPQAARATPAAASPKPKPLPPAPIEAEPLKPEPSSAATSPAVKVSGSRSIQSELELIRAAQKHLHRNEARAALALLTEHAQRFPAGALSEEREASRVFALCQLGDAAGARAQADRFLQRSPKSPFAERVRSTCRSSSR